MCFLIQGKIWMIKSHASGYKVITPENTVPLLVLWGWGEERENENQDAHWANLSSFLEPWAIPILQPNCPDFETEVI